MFVFVAILLIIISILLIVVVLLQPGKGDMISGMGTVGSSISTMFGARRASDMLTKITIGLAIALMFFALITNKFFIGNNVEEIERPITEGISVPTQAIPAPIVPSAPVPTDGNNPTE